MVETCSLTLYNINKTVVLTCRSINCISQHSVVPLFKPGVVPPRPPCDCVTWSGFDRGNDTDKDKIVNYFLRLFFYKEFVADIGKRNVTANQRTAMFVSVNLGS